jgi:hypothetical protein
MRESQRPSPGYSSTRNIPDVKDRFGIPISKERIDEQLLELILIDSVAKRDLSRSHRADSLTDSLFTASDYARMIDRYDELSDDEDDEAGLEEYFFLRASVKDSHWKSKMLRLFVYIVGGGHGLSNEGLTEVASLAAAMGALREWDGLLKALTKK